MTDTPTLCMTVAALTAVLSSQLLSAADGPLQELNTSYQAASGKTDGNELTVSTGKVTRTWSWTGKGLATAAITGLESGKQWAKPRDAEADWNLGNLGEGKLVSLKAFEDDDERFTSKHLAVEAEIRYPTLDVKYVIWAYPGAPGLRTQLWLKRPANVDVKAAKRFDPDISETLGLAGDARSVTAFGYAAGLKANMKPYEILRTESLPAGGRIDWANGLIADFEGAGIVLVKESHNHTMLGKGLETGAFERMSRRPRGEVVRVTGLGMLPGDLKTDAYRFCWANWMVLYTGGDVEAQLAIKRFDRARYPVHPGRDVFIMANTWGTEDKSPQCRYKAREENVLREIKEPFELHDGKTVSEDYRMYPSGFGKVRARAKELGVRLGLWHAWTAPTPSIKANIDEGDFRGIKLDFANLRRKDQFDSLYDKAREIIRHSEYRSVVNWDVTEISPRMGFYFGRDCGNLYLTNRKAFTVRDPVRYDPWQVLRDGWELARYMNLNKVQVTFQNKDITPPPAKTDALKSTHAYNLAITLMASPIFFTETQYLSAAARDEIRPIIKAYKAEREQMYRGYVFAIGDKPDNASWTGFQNHDPETGAGYLTIFRELNCEEPAAKLALHFLPRGTKLTLTDVLTGESRQTTLDDHSRAEFRIEKAPGFLFLKYGTK